MLFLLCRGGYDWGEWYPFEDTPDGVVSIPGQYYIEEECTVREHVDILYQHIYADQYVRLEKTRLDRDYNDWCSEGHFHSQEDVSESSDKMIKYKRLQKRDGLFVEFDTWDQVTAWAVDRQAAIVSTEYLDILDRSRLFALVI